MRRFWLTTIALIPLSVCDRGDLPAAYRDLTVPAARLASSEALSRWSGPLPRQLCALPPVFPLRGEARTRGPGLSQG